jgi:hypothetical protein
MIRLRSRLRIRVWIFRAQKRSNVGDERFRLGNPGTDLVCNEHRDRTHYRQCRRGGYPLGSGGIESSNKFICHVRLKRSGAWWYETNSNQMLPFAVPSITAPLIKCLCVIKND